MKYENIIYGIFKDRPNRFIANVYIDGILEKVHVKNTSWCKELLIPGVKVILEDKSYIKSRKTKYSIICVYKRDRIINIDSQAPNEVVYDALKENKIKDLINLDYIKREVTFENSRFDIAFSKDNKSGFLEVKGVTLEENNLARFPDAPTTRGEKHVLEMIKAVKKGYLGYILFLIQLEDVDKFYLNWEMDTNFSKAVVKAKNSGVKILAYDSIVKPDFFIINKQIPIDFTDYRKNKKVRE